MASVEELKSRIQQLEAELEQERAGKAAGSGRQRIDQMSAEVVDSNPYRLVVALLYYVWNLLLQCLWAL